MRFIVLLGLFLTHYSWGKAGIPRVDLNLKNFNTVLEGKFPQKIKVKVLEDTLVWERSGIHLVPSVYLNVHVKGKEQSYGNYKNQKFLFKKNKKSQTLHIKYYLFESEKIQLISGENKISLYLKFNESQVLHHIDYSCIRYNVQIQNADRIPLSVSCSLDTYGDFFDEKSTMAIFIHAPFWSHQDNTGILRLNINKSGSSEFELAHDLSSEKQNITINYKFKSERDRLKTAYGFGPYNFFFQEGSHITEEWTSPLFFYANFRLTKENSLRMFNAFVWNDSYFNNAGFYYAYTMGIAFDGLLTITPLIGFQGITTYNEVTEETYNDFIGPQGFELLWRHAFGIENYIVGAGLFLSPGNDTDYKNVWIRWGKGFFWEINYLSFRKTKRDLFTKSWGFSVGLPFFSLF